MNEEKGNLIKVDIAVLGPRGHKPLTLKKEDVWGKFGYSARIDYGMVIANHVMGDLPNVCPVWGDVLPYKAVTVKCKPEQVAEVVYWLEYVHGADCVTRTTVLYDGMVAMRSEYQCW